MSTQDKLTLEYWEVYQWDSESDLDANKNLQKVLQICIVDYMLSFNLGTAFNTGLKLEALSNKHYQWTPKRLYNPKWIKTIHIDKSSSAGKAIEFYVEKYKAERKGHLLEMYKLLDMESLYSEWS